MGMICHMLKGVYLIRTRFIREEGWVIYKVSPDHSVLDLTMGCQGTHRQVCRVLMCLTLGVNMLDSTIEMKLILYSQCKFGDTA